MFVCHCACLQITEKALWVLSWRLQINFSEQENLQILNPQIRINYIIYMFMNICVISYNSIKFVLVYIMIRLIVLLLLIIYLVSNFSFILSLFRTIRNFSSNYFPFLFHTDTLWSIYILIFSKLKQFTYWFIHSFICWPNMYWSPNVFQAYCTTF